MPTEDNQLLLPGPSTNDVANLSMMSTKLAVQSLFENLKYEMDNNTRRQASCCFWTQFIFAGISGGLYWLSSQKPTQRYQELVKQSDSSSWLAWFFEAKMPNTCGAVTNTFFNAESFQTIWENITQRPSYAQSYLTAINHEYTAWTIAFIASFGVTLPFWWTAFSGASLMMKSFATVSAIFNLPVNTDGAKSLIDWAKSFDCKDRTLDYLGTVNFFTSTQTRQENRQQRERRLVFRMARNLLVAHLKQQARYFSTISDQQIRHDILSQIIGNSDNPTTWKQMFAFILSTDNSASQLSSTTPSACCSGVSVAIKALLGLLGMYQNFGPMMDAYVAGAKLHQALGYLAAICNALPSLGFSIKGITGEGLVDIFQQVMRQEKSLESIESPKLYWALILVAMVTAVFSGFTGDQLNYEAWKDYIGMGKDTGALISGILGNIGTAITFNLPQCVLFVTRCLDLYLLKTGQEAVVKLIMLKDGIENIAKVLQHMPMARCEEFFNDNEMPQAQFFAILHAKMGDDIGLLGNYYRDKITPENSLGTDTLAMA